MEVLPGLLNFGPSPAGGNGVSVNAVELGNRPEYYVQHYAVGALSEAFGPYALDQILVFCRRLKALLVSRSRGQQQPPLHLSYKADDAEEHTNSCVLLGAYLVLAQGWSTSQIVKVLGKKEAERTFMCSWQRSVKMVMPVLACWEGLEVAVEYGWINRACLNDDVYTDFACSKFRSMVATFDASWLIPGKILVAADPSTTVHDPNPATFRYLWSTEGDIDTPPQSPYLQPRTECDNIGDCDARSDSTETPRCLLSEPMLSSKTDAIKEVVDINDGSSSVETVCKEYQFPVMSNDKDNSQRAKSFSDFLLECEIKVMVRCNYSNEQGMPKQGYSADKLIEYGIVHKDIQFEDKRGGLPFKSHVAAMISAGTPVIDADAGAVLVHCKGGFGRSMVLACCLAIHTYNISGRALLGWCRIARPGAVTTVLQEEFLMSLKGRDDVAKFAGVAPVRQPRKQRGGIPDAAQPACGPGCTVM